MTSGAYMQLKMLTDDKLCALICEDYWRQNEDGKFTLTVQEIANKYEMKPHILSSFVRQHAYVWLTTIFCIRCEQPFRLGSRLQYQERNRYRRQVCNSCITTEHQAVADMKKTILVEMRQSAENRELDLKSIDLKSSIYLLAAIQALGDEHLSRLEPLSDYPACTLSPDTAYDHKVLRYLIDNHLLLIGLNTSLEAIDSEGQINFEMSTFDIALDQNQITKLINDFTDASTVYNIKHNIDFIDLCSEIQLNECLAFLKAMLAEHQLTFVPGEKTKQVMSRCLEKLSPTQVYNFIWRAVTNAAAYYMRGSVSKRQAANSVVGSISRYMEQSLANDWDVKTFKRNYNLPQSSLSRIVFNTVLGTDDGGFKQPLHELIQQKILLSI